MAHPEMRVALVGRRLPHNENLGLAYLRAALARAGVASTTHYVNDAIELAQAIAAIRAARPDVVGLSLADGGSAVLPLALGEALSRAGFAGHITSGGQFATLARTWLLNRYPWLDSVVRFAGEGPLVEICARLARGEAVFGAPGVTTREGDGPPAPVLDQAPLLLRPQRDNLPELLGHPAAHIAASRGCRGRCHYCGPAALQTEERREGRRGGFSVPVLSAHGVGGVRRREIGAVCEEMAHLWHERGVRYFYFVDEHLLPYDEPEALAFLDAWREGLAARKVGPLGIGAMLRADRLTPAIVRAFADLGLVRAFVGLEIAGEAEARRFGRAAPTARELDLLRVFAEAGVTTVSNLMLVHPYATAASIAAGIDLLEALPAGVFEATRMQVYHGTRLHEELAAEGRVRGNPLRYGYDFDDPVTSRFAEIFSRLRGEAFWNYSVAYRTHDAYLALSLARRLHPERVRREMTERLDGVRARVNRLYVLAYRRALSLAEQGGGFAEAADLVAELRPLALELERDLDRVEALVLTAAPPHARMFAPMRAAAAGVLSFAVAASAPACGAKVAVDGTTADAGHGGHGGTGGSPVVPCADAGNATEAQVQAVLAAGDACFSGVVNVATPPPAPDFQIGAYVGGFDLTACNTPVALQAKKAQDDAAAAALANACISGASPPIYTYVQGGASTDAQKMAEAIWAACSPLLAPNNPQFDVILDANGTVVQVKADPSMQAVADCVMKALAGLTFPCLASFEVCPEYVIAE